MAGILSWRCHWQSMENDNCDNVQEITELSLQQNHPVAHARRRTLQVLAPGQEQVQGEEKRKRRVQALDERVLKILADYENGATAGVIKAFLNSKPIGQIVAILDSLERAGRVTADRTRVPTIYRRIGDQA